MSRPALAVARKILLGLLIFFGLLIGLLAAFTAWQFLRPPVRALDRPLDDVRVVADSSYTVVVDDDLRLYRDVVLFGSRIDTARFTVSLPADLEDVPRLLPVVPVIGGLEIGRESLAYVSEHGENALLAYEYPYGPEYWYEGTDLRELPGIRRAVLNVPAQVTAMTDWAHSQPWADADRTTLFGYSFGAMFLPASHRVAGRHQIEFQAAVMLYGGVDLYRLLEHNLLIENALTRRLFAGAAAVLLRPIEPALHAPHLEGEFLVVNGRRDELIPAELGRRLQDLTPEPKTTMMLDSPHMHPQARDLIDYLVGICMNWMQEREAIN